MSKKESLTAFPAVVCERMRRLVQERSRCKSKREQEFEARDEALARYHDLDGDEASRNEALCEYARHVLEIDRLGKTIAWCANELAGAIEKADEPGLFDMPDLEIPDFDDKPKPSGQGRLPVGVVPPVTPIPPAEPTGVDLHLDAPIAELSELSPNVLDTLKGRVETIRQLAVMIDSEDLADKLEISDAMAAIVTKAVQRFRAHHRKAMLSAEREALEGATHISGGLTVAGPEAGAGAGKGKRGKR